MSKDKIYNSSTNEFDSKNLKKIQESPEYIENQKQIDCITKVLVEHSDVPPKLLDWLIEAVEKNATLIYKSLN